MVWVQVKKIIEKKSQKSAPLWLHSNILGHWTFEKFFSITDGGRGRAGAGVYKHGEMLLRAAQIRRGATYSQKQSQYVATMQTEYTRNSTLGRVSVLGQMY